MFLIILFTVIGFLTGLSYVMVKRKIKPGNILTAAFLGLLSAAIWKLFRDYAKYQRRK